jgi:RNA polymerase sigma-70 factor (ECF subfamily)
MSSSPGRPSARSVAAEAELVAGLKSGSEAAYEELVRTYGPALFAVARRYLPVEQDAQDALQEAFVNVSRSIRGFAGESRLSTWLHRVVVNCALMRLRSRRRHPEVPIQDVLLEDVAHAGQASWEWTASEILGQRELRQKVRDAVAALPESSRTAIVLRDVEGLELAEVARLLGIAVSTVKVRLHQARRTLRALLEPQLAPTE